MTGAQRALSNRIIEAAVNVTDGIPIEDIPQPLAVAVASILYRCGADLDAFNRLVGTAYMLCAMNERGQGS